MRALVLNLIILPFLVSCHPAYPGSAIPTYLPNGDRGYVFYSNVPLNWSTGREYAMSKFERACNGPAEIVSYTEDTSKQLTTFEAFAKCASGNTAPAKGP